MNEETMVGTVTAEQGEQSAQDDTVLAAAESTEESESSNASALSEILGIAPQEESEQETQDSVAEQPQEKPNNGIKGRLNAAERKGYDAGRQAAESQYQQTIKSLQDSIERLNNRIESYEQRDRVAEIRKKYSNLPDDVAEFLAKQGFQSAEESPKAEQPRDASGRFVSTKQNDVAPNVQERANFLFEQSKTIQALTGVDAMELYANADAATKNKIANGEMDFIQLVQMQSDSKQTETNNRRKPPNVKSSSAESPRKTISNMSDDDIDKLNESLRKGVVIDMSR